MSITNALKHPTTGAITVPAHSFGAALHLWAVGKINKAQAMAGMKAPADSSADLDAMAAVYNARAAGAARLEYVLLAERMAIVLQNGSITAAQFRSFMEIPA